MFRRLSLLFIVVALSAAAAGAPANGLATIHTRDLREWLTYIASDELEGRGDFSEGLGLAGDYVQAHLRSWNVQPKGDPGTYLQTVRVQGVKSSNHSTLTVKVNGETRTFAEGNGITFPKNVGLRRQFTVDRVEFAGYGLDAPLAHHQDYAGKDVKGAVVVWLGSTGPKGLDARTYRRLLSGRNRYATEQLGAAASIGVAVPNPFGGPLADSASAERPASTGARSAAAPAGRSQPAGRGQPLPAPDFTTVQRLDSPIPPNVTGSDAFFEFLFSHAPTHYSELKARAAAQDPLPTFRLEGVTLTFNLDADYEVVRTQLTHNIVGVVEGTDPQLKSTYVAFGAHYDHVGYAEGEIVEGENGGAPRRLGAPGRVTDGAIDDRIWNGADDDGSGTVALLALARAFAEGPRPRRSLLFVWHVGEERGLWGSRYFADHPTVPIASIVAQLNMDMIGRNRDNKASEANTVYLVGSDRISTELHRINQAANRELPAPLALDYELNDPSDLEQIYFRSDHYSYASKGIPIIFFTTGLHPDYHANTDDVSKIEFDKLTRIVQLVYETGWDVANLDHAPVRDNRGARAGKATDAP